ncbi:MAG: glycosyltransferase family 39 protein [Bacteroidia bacterium]|nr:glycosyltransferase family 39 protein [Bacteroidia bacterium]MDW8014402.1 glycosyltransferase family 39 protein [Bacteroidia bacterium]
MPFRLPSILDSHRKIIFPLLLIAGFALLWTIGIGRIPLFDWDEVNFAECAREMRLTDEYLYAQIGFLPFWEKPPLFFWIQTLSMKIWGETAFAARFPNVLISLLTLFTLYRLGSHWHGSSFGITWLFLYGVSLLPSFYARSALIDPLFNFFMLLAVVMGSAGLERQRPSLHSVVCGIAAACATLTKGPVGSFLPALALATAGVMYRRLRELIRLGLIGGLSYLIIVGGWIYLLYRRGEADLLEAFWAYQWRLFSTADAGHAGPWYYHLLVLSLGMFPASWWAIGMKRIRQLPLSAQILLFLTGWTIVIFSIVKTKILHYSSLAYYGIAYMAAWVWTYRHHWIERWGWILFNIGAILFGILTVGGGILMTQTSLWMTKLRDPFVRAAIQDTPLQWSGWEGWMGLILIGGVSFLNLLTLGRWKRLILAGGLVGLWQMLTLATFAPRIELYTQGPLRRFAEEKAAEGAVVWCLGFKSYIPYFYGRMQPGMSPKLTGDPIAFQNFLLSAEVPVPVYFVSRVDRYQSFIRTYSLEVLGYAGGYVFLRPNPLRRGAIFPWA